MTIKRTPRLVCLSWLPASRHVAPSRVPPRDIASSDCQQLNINIEQHKNISLSDRIIMGNEWQVVQNPKTRSKSKQANSKGASTNNLTATAESAQRDPAGAAFAQLDADWSRQNGARKANGTTGGFASLEVYMYKSS